MKTILRSVGIQLLADLFGRLADVLSKLVAEDMSNKDKSSN